MCNSFQICSHSRSLDDQLSNEVIAEFPTILDRFLLVYSKPQVILSGWRARGGREHSFRYIHFKQIQVILTEASHLQQLLQVDWLSRPTSSI